MMWTDDGVEIDLYVSMTGDFVSLGDRTEYPFKNPVSGIPEGWTRTVVGGVAADVNWTTQDGRFSVSNISTTDAHNGFTYGIYRDFPIAAGHKYLFHVQARQMKNKSKPYRHVTYQLDGTGVTYGSVVACYDDWEQVVMSVTHTGFVRIFLRANPYWENAKDFKFDWGAQFQSFAIVDMLETYAPPTWHKVTCDTVAVRTAHGRDRMASRYEVATAEVVINNDDGEFAYQVNHPWGFRPGRFIRITAKTPDSPTQERPMFFGIIDTITDAYSLAGHAVVNMNCIDVSSLLSNTEVPTITSADYETLSGLRFTLLYMSAGWLDSMAAVDGGVFIQQDILATGRSIREELGIIADSEGGYFYADRTGKLVFKDRDAPTRMANWNTVQAELLAECPQWVVPGNPASGLPPSDTVPTVPNPPIALLQSLETDWSRDRVINTLELANQRGSAFQFVDGPSQKHYGPRTYQRLDFVNSNAHPEYLTTRAADIMDGFTDAVVRVNAIGFRPNTETYKWAADAFLNDLVRVRYTHPTGNWGFSVASHIQGIEHSISPHSWEMMLRLDEPESFNRWVLSTTGWDQGLWDDALWDGG